MVKSPDELAIDNTAGASADESVARSGETLRQDEWRAELLRVGIRAKGKQMLHFSRGSEGTRHAGRDCCVSGGRTCPGRGRLMLYSTAAC
jgi:hypothetical protein